MACGIVYQEEAYCRTHCAELLGLPKPRVDYLVKTGVFHPREAAHAHRQNCDKKWRGRALIVMGEIIDYQDQL